MRGHSYCLKIQVQLQGFRHILIQLWGDMNPLFFWNAWTLISSNRCQSRLHFAKGWLKSVTHRLRGNLNYIILLIAFFQQQIIVNFFRWGCFPHSLVPSLFFRVMKFVPWYFWWLIHIFLLKWLKRGPVRQGESNWLCQYICRYIK